VEGVGTVDGRVGIVGDRGMSEEGNSWVRGGVEGHGGGAGKSDMVRWRVIWWGGGGVANV
jgi:hypothetical protein